jgi:AmmeMemoRadiSam system protein A
VESAVEGNKNSLIEKEMPKKFLEKAAVFVTLKEDGELRGCIGSIIPHDMLYIAVASAAVSAALHDPRFLAVSADDLPFLSYDISVLSRFKVVSDINKIEIGRHGLLIQTASNRGLLLPQVASEHGWDITTFLEQTCIKAALPRNAWKTLSANIFSFSASVFNS